MYCYVLRTKVQHFFIIENKSYNQKNIADYVDSNDKFIIFAA